MLYLVPTYERPAYQIYSRPAIDLSCNFHGYNPYAYGISQYEYENYLRQQQLLALKRQREREYQQRLLIQRQRLARRDAQRVMSILALAEDIYNQYYDNDEEVPAQESQDEQVHQSVQDQEQEQEQDQQEEEKENVRPAPSTRISIPIEDGDDENQIDDDIPMQDENQIDEDIPMQEQNHAAPQSEDCAKSESGKSTRSDKSDSLKSDASYSMIELLRQKEADPVILE